MKGRIIEREIERKVFNPLACKWLQGSRPGQAKSRTLDFHSGLPSECKDPTTGSSSVAFPGMLPESCVRGRATRTQWCSDVAYGHHNSSSPITSAPKPPFPHTHETEPLKFHWGSKPLFYIGSLIPERKQKSYFPESYKTPFKVIWSLHYYKAWQWAGRGLGLCSWASHIFGAFYTVKKSSKMMTLVEKEDNVYIPSGFPGTMLWGPQSEGTDVLSDLPFSTCKVVYLQRNSVFVVKPIFFTQCIYFEILGY